MLITPGVPADLLGRGVPPLDERRTRSRLADLGLDLRGEDEGLLEVGAGSVFWQLMLVRDAQGRLAALEGEVYEDEPLSATDVQLMYEALRDLAAALGARAWVDAGSRWEELTPSRRGELVAEGRARATGP